MSAPVESSDRPSGQEPAVRPRRRRWLLLLLLLLGGGSLFGGLVGFSGCPRNSNGSGSGTTPGGQPPDNIDPLPIDPEQRLRAMVGRGAHYINLYNCRSCHWLGELGGSNAPALDGVMAKYTRILGSPEAAREFFRHHLENPVAYPGVEKAHYPFVQMPIIPFRPGDIDCIVEYLSTLTEE